MHRAPAHACMLARRTVRRKKLQQVAPEHLRFFSSASAGRNWAPLFVPHSCEKPGPFHKILNLRPNTFRTRQSLQSTLFHQKSSKRRQQMRGTPSKRRPTHVSSASTSAPGSTSPRHCHPKANAVSDVSVLSDHRSGIDMHAARRGAAGWRLVSTPAPWHHPSVSPFNCVVTHRFACPFLQNVFLSFIRPFTTH